VEVVYRCTECSSRFVYEDGVNDFEGARARLQHFHGMRCDGSIEYEAHVAGRKEALPGADPG
jgi:DNA-directed RNA polymerase subunit RPC12/RpoP